MPSYSHNLIGPEHKRLTEPFKEHGGLYVECLDCGAQWALDEDGNADEEVSHGDGSCLDLAIDAETKKENV